jgi:hypothetical protein
VKLLQLGSRLFILLSARIISKWLRIISSYQRASWRALFTRSLVPEPCLLRGDAERKQQKAIEAAQKRQRAAAAQLRKREEKLAKAQKKAEEQLGSPSRWATLFER